MDQMEQMEGDEPHESERIISDARVSLKQSLRRGGLWHAQVIDATNGGRRMERLLVRPAEAAEILGLGRSKVYEMLASGELPVVKIGKSVRVPLEALRGWVQERVSAAENDASSVWPNAAGRDR